MKRPSLKRAIEWIDDNDSNGDNDPIEILQGLISVLLVADLFDTDPREIARRIWNARNPDKHISFKDNEVAK